MSTSAPVSVRCFVNARSPRGRDHQQETRMSKGMNQKKNTKKAPAKTADEKRAAKKEKKNLKK
jgi:hypothetical protein